MRHLIPFAVLLLMSPSLSADDDCRCRKVKAALALSAAKGPNVAVAPAPKEKGAAKPACSVCESCACKTGVCPACPATEKKLVTTSGRVLLWTGTVYVYAGESAAPALAPNCVGPR
jgi:hypothetical protein